MKKKIILSSGLFILILTAFASSNYLTKSYKLYKLNKERYNLTQNHKLSENIDIFFKKKINYINKLIAHAGGGIEEKTYTNSKEAVKKSIKNNFKLIELDLKITSDKKIVAAHDWRSFIEITNCCKKNENLPLSIQKFRKQKIFNKYSIIDYRIINEIFSKNKDLILVTDKTNNFELINQQLNFDKNRIIVEIFGQNNYFKALKTGILNPMLSASAADIEFIKKFNVKIIAIHSAELKRNYNVYLDLKKRGVIIFVYSTNDIKFINENKNAVSAFYTDYLSPNKLVCKSTNCKTY